jgi:hypothetical protein
MPLPVPAPVDPVALKKIHFYELLCEAERLAVELYREESIALSVLRKNHEPIRFYDGFAHCRAWGKSLDFPTLSQRCIVEVMWEPWQGSSERVVRLPIETILERAGLNPNTPIQKFFRDQKRKRVHPALGYLLHFTKEIGWMGPPESPAPSPS